MTYQLPSDVEQLVKQYMASGAYASEDDVLRDALGALDRIELEKAAKWNQRNALATEQSNRGLSSSLNAQEVLSRLRENLAKDGIVE